MDSHAGSQPRSFISFRLGETANGQPTQLGEKEMETDQLSDDVTDQASFQTEDDIEVIEITISSPEPEGTGEKDPAIDNATPQLAKSPQVKKESESTSLLAELY